MSGWQTGGRGAGVTAVQRNQINTDNIWSAEEACGHWAEVREPLTTTVAHSACIFFYLQYFAPLLFLSAPVYLTSSDSLSSSQALLWLPYTLYELSLYPFIYFSFHFLTSIFKTLTLSFFLGLMNCLSTFLLFTCWVYLAAWHLSLTHFSHLSLKGIVWHFWK